jgi:hypothetical protein
MSDYIEVLRKRSADLQRYAEYHAMQNHDSMVLACRAEQAALDAAISALAAQGGEPLREFYEAKASGLGWDKEDGEGCIEYLMRRSYETGHEDAINQRSTHGPHEPPVPVERGEGAKPTTVPREPAPPHSLPEWHECQSVIEAHEFHLRAIAGKEGPQLITIDPDAREPTELERFINEYDDADRYRSEWFLYRLEKLIKSIRAEQKPQPAAHVDGGWAKELERKWRARANNRTEDGWVMLVNCANELRDAALTEGARVTDAQLTEVLDAADSMLRWCVKNVTKWNFPEYDRLHKARAALKRAEKGEGNEEV